jgi:hypothetical protein
MEIIKWIVTSSSDPSRYSLMFKGAAMMAIPYVLQALQLVCGLTLICLSVDGSVLTSVVDTVANIIYLVFSLVGAMAFLWGLGRKIWLNRWSAYQVAPNNLPTQD